MPGNPNSSKASRANMYSNRSTAINVSGGDKKAGLVPTATGPYQNKIYMRDRGVRQSLAFMMLNSDGTPNISTVCQSRPIGSDVNFNIYWKCPNLPR